MKQRLLSELVRDADTDFSYLKNTVEQKGLTFAPSELRGADT